MPVNWNVILTAVVLVLVWEARAVLFNILIIVLFVLLMILGAAVICALCLFALIGLVLERIVATMGRFCRAAG